MVRAARGGAPPNGNPAGRGAFALAALSLPGGFDISFSELLAYRRRTVNLYLRWQEHCYAIRAFYVRFST